MGIEHEVMLGFGKPEKGILTRHPVVVVQSTSKDGIDLAQFLLKSDPFEVGKDATKVRTHLQFGPSCYSYHEKLGSTDLGLQFMDKKDGRHFYSIFPLTSEFLSKLDFELKCEHIQMGDFTCVRWGYSESSLKKLDDQIRPLFKKISRDSGELIIPRFLAEITDSKLIVAHSWESAFDKPMFEYGFILPDEIVKLRTQDELIVDKDVLAHYFKTIDVDGFKIGVSDFQFRPIGVIGSEFDLAEQFKHIPGYLGKRSDDIQIKKAPWYVR